MVNTSCRGTFNLSALLTGLSHSPRPDKAEFVFSMKDNKTYSAYVDHIKDFLKAYDWKKQEGDTFENCGGTSSKIILKLYKPKLLAVL